VMPSCLVEGRGVLFPTLSWHLPPAGKNRRYDLSKGGKGKPVDLPAGASSGLPSIGGTAL
jgi:hypothetical protein